MRRKQKQNGSMMMTMRKYMMAASLGLLALLVFAMPVMAGRTWCARDPIVKLNDTKVQIWVAIPEEYVPYVNGPIDTKVQTPAEVERNIEFLDEGFNGHGEVLKFHDLVYGTRLDPIPATVAPDGTFDVQVSTIVPVNRDLLRKQTRLRSIPLQLTIIFEDGTSQVIEMTNDGAKISFKLQGK